jgi:VWFA-related protein
MRVREAYSLIPVVAMAMAVAANATPQEQLPSAPSATIEQRRQSSTPKPPPEPPAAPAAKPPEAAPVKPAGESGASSATSSSAPAAADGKPAQPSAQTGPADQAPEEPLETIRKSVDEVNVIFTVTDKRGHFVKNLSKTDFDVLDDRKPPTSIVNFRSETDLPLRVGLLVDASNSIRDRFKFEQESAIEFLNQIVRPRSDRAFVLGFDTTAEVTQDFTDSTEKLSQGVRLLRPGGGTALYDAVFFACRDKLMKTSETGPTRRAIILLSDGEDNQSRVTREEAIDMAQRAEVIVYAISTNVSGVKLKGDKVLERMAEATGGRAFFPYKIEDVANAFTDIQDELRSQYAMAYHPADFLSDGHFRSIEIKSGTKKDLKVRTRRGYYSPKQ